MRSAYTLSILTILSTTAFADTLVTADGTSFTGRVIREDAGAVTIETTSAGIVIEHAIPRSRISSLKLTPKPAGPAYLEVPLIGTVGQQVTAAALEDSFAAARGLGATHVVLLLDSPGGTIVEMEKIIDVLSHHSDVKTIAFVKNANSAAALIAASCGTIVMHPLGKCGAAVPYLADKQGMPAAVSEKLTSAMRATARNAARVGGRPPELLIGMIDADFELWGVEQKGQVSILLEKPEVGGMCIKPKGKVLTVTPEEAVRYGLAKGICRSMKELGAVVGAESWQSCGDDAWEIMRRYAAAREANVDQEQREASADRAKATEQQTKDAEIAAIKQRIRDSQSAVAAFKKQLAGLDKQLEDELQKLLDEHKAAIDSVALGGEGKALKEVQARETYQAGVERAHAADAARRSDINNAIAILQQRIDDDSQRIKQTQP